MPSLTVLLGEFLACVEPMPRCRYTAEHCLRDREVKPDQAI